MASREAHGEIGPTTPTLLCAKNGDMFADDAWEERFGDVARFHAENEMNMSIYYVQYRYV